MDLPSPLLAELSREPSRLEIVLGGLLSQPGVEVFDSSATPDALHPDFRWIRFHGRPHDCEFAKQFLDFPLLSRTGEAGNSHTSIFPNTWHLFHSQNEKPWQRTSAAENDGRPEWIRTIDLFRVKEALWTN